MKKHLLLLPDGTELSSGTGEGSAIVSVTLTQCVNSGEELTPGSVCCAVLEMKLITPGGDLSLSAGDEVTLYEVDGAGERAQLGRFLLEKPTRTSPDTLELTAYDFVSRLDRDVSVWLVSLTEWPYRLDTFAEMVCGVCGVALTPGEIPNGDYPVAKFSGEGITGRQLMEWAAQAAGRFLRATPEGSLEFAWYAPGPEAVGPTGERFYYQGSLRYADYAVEPIRRVRIQLTEDDVGVAYPDTEGEVNTYAVTGNYLLTADNSEALLPVAQALYETLEGFTYTPFQASVPAELNVRAGDILTVRDKNGGEFQTVVMTRTHTAGRDALESTGSPRRDSTEALNNTTLKAVTGRVLEVKKSIEGLRVSAQAVREQVERNSTDLSLVSDGIQAVAERTTEDLEGLHRQLAQLELSFDQLEIAFQNVTVDEVTTKTGYTFNADGLDVHKDGDEIHNTIDNTGMYVRRGNGDSSVTMLQANADGVEAANLLAKNFLTVAHARFEDYGDGRTACFYL